MSRAPGAGHVPGPAARPPVPGAAQRSTGGCRPCAPGTAAARPESWPAPSSRLSSTSSAVPRIKLKTHRSLVTRDDGARPPRGGEVPRRAVTTTRRGPPPGGAGKQQGTRRGRMGPAQIVPTTSVSWPGRPSVSKTDSPAPTANGSTLSASSPLNSAGVATPRLRGSRSDLADDPVTQPGLALVPARPEHGGTANRLGFRTWRASWTCPSPRRPLSSTTRGWSACCLSPRPPKHGEFPPTPNEEFAGHAEPSRVPCILPYCARMARSCRPGTTRTPTTTTGKKTTAGCRTAPAGPCSAAWNGSCIPRPGCSAAPPPDEHSRRHPARRGRHRRSRPASPPG